jgi:hypothetical protein
LIIHVQLQQELESTDVNGRMGPDRRSLAGVELWLAGGAVLIATQQMITILNRESTAALQKLLFLMRLVMIANSYFAGCLKRQFQ